MIQLTNVSKYYPIPSGVRHILRDVTLTIPGGTNLAVLGPNGAGKSTFLRLIGGAEGPNGGRIWSDQSISWPLGISSGFQGSLTGRQNVLFVCRINGLNAALTRQVIEEVTEFAEIGEYFDLPVRLYSSGMRARLSFGLSMAFEFDVYLVDELTSVGDAVFRNKAKKAFRDMRDRASLIFVSHNLQTLQECCESALFLHDGTATYFDKIKDGIDAYQDYIRSDRLGHAKEIRGLRKARRAERRRVRKESGVKTKKKKKKDRPEENPAGE